MATDAPTQGKCYDCFRTPCTCSPEKLALKAAQQRDEAARLADFEREKDRRRKLRRGAELAVRGSTRLAIAGLAVVATTVVGVVLWVIGSAVFTFFQSGEAGQALHATGRGVRWALGAYGRWYWHQAAVPKVVVGGLHVAALGGSLAGIAVLIGNRLPKPEDLTLNDWTTRREQAKLARAERRLGKKR